MQNRISRVLIIHPNYGEGGVEKNLSLFFDYLTSQGISVDLLTSTNPLPGCAPKYHRIFLTKRRILLSAKKFSEVIFKHSFDQIWIFQAPCIAFYPALYSLFKIFLDHKAKIVAFERIHPTSFFHRKRSLPYFRYLAYKLGLYFSNIITANSHELLHYAKRLCPGRRYIYVPNITLFPNDLKSLKLNPSTHEDPIKNILWMGRLEQIKRPLLAVHALSYLPENYHLYIYGKGSILPSLSKLINELHLSKRVTYTEQPCTISKTRFCAVLNTSQLEGLPNTVLESLASSLPVVSTYFISGLYELFIPFWIYMSDDTPSQLASSIMTSQLPSHIYERSTSDITSLLSNYYSITNQHCALKQVIS